MRSVTFRPLDNEHLPRRMDSLDELVALLCKRRFAVLTGAGCSTDSGIPDYRGPTGSLRKRQPMQHQEFLRSESARRRYWARSAVGWPTIALARPNAAHLALASLEQAGRITGLVTQNVDGLHRRAGSSRVVELHGSLHLVRCLSCGLRIERAALQEELLSQNPALRAALAESAPDGDADIDGRLAQDFLVPTCRGCGGTLKPDVVFFGDNVARQVVDEAFSLIDAADALLICGSSLAVYSGFRFARGAVERGIPVAIVNLGPTRADELATLRVEAPVAEVLRMLASKLTA